LLGANVGESSLYNKIHQNFVALRGNTGRNSVCFSPAFPGVATFGINGTRITLLRRFPLSIRSFAEGSGEAFGLRFGRITLPRLFFFIDGANRDRGIHA
jgi:hypothetical protein